MIFSTLASGSSGNAAVVSDGDTNLLVDAGISTRKIVSGLSVLDIHKEDLSAILITHDHSDHIKGLPVLVKHTCATIYAPGQVADLLCKELPHAQGRIVTFEPGEGFEVGGISVCSFPTPHDALSSCGYSICSGRKKVTCVTDLGHITPSVQKAVAGADLVMLEANYDPDMLISGSYPAFLKTRIRGRNGHLSNPESAELALHAMNYGTRHMVLAHLSRDNNTPAVADREVRRALISAGGRPEDDFALSVAPRDCPGMVIEL